MNIQTIASNPTVLSTPKNQSVTATQPQEAKPQSNGVIDTFLGMTAGAQSTALFGAVGGGALGFFAMKEGTSLHRVLFSVLGAASGGAAGAVAGGLGGAVAGALSDSKSGGAAAGAVTGAVAGAAAFSIMALKSGQFDLPAVAGGALVGAALGAVGGYTAAAVKLRP